MAVIRDGTQKRLLLNQEPPENSCRPAVDVLFRSVATAFGADCLGVVLTGMGADGLRGCEAIHGAGGQILAQDEATSVVWGMPGCVARANLADRVMPLALIADEIVGRVRAVMPLPLWCRGDSCVPPGGSLRPPQGVSPCGKALLLSSRCVFGGDFPVDVPLLQDG